MPAEGDKGNGCNKQTYRSNGEVSCSVSDEEEDSQSENDAADDEVLLVGDSLRGLGELAHIHGLALTACDLLAEGEVEEHYGYYKRDSGTESCICKEVEE